ncbi:MAG: hypothetical protein BroJett018_21200 [Chloroflexota bacterium]|nr:hypothetical protein [Chloroflexota bacterium]NOG65413.1 hypothetical protein [Chloroflexota bacterium]GIK64326.1 MAG: hypothetical protein BroJett018_21200 [Chloroflexota bacterium]
MSHQTSPKSMITQTYVGQITVVGECFCYGCALDGQQLVYLDVAGPATSVEAVWAKLAQGKECSIIPPEHDAQKIILRTAEGQLKRLQRKVEGIGIHHLLLIHQDLLTPTYAELSTTYLFLVDKSQTTAKLGSHIQQLVDIAVFPEWYAYLVQQGRVEGLITPLACYGGTSLWKIILDKTAWQRVICRGVSQGHLHLPA